MHGVTQTGTFWTAACGPRLHGVTGRGTPGPATLEGCLRELLRCPAGEARRRQPETRGPERENAVTTQAPRSHTLASLMTRTRPLSGPPRGPARPARGACQQQEPLGGKRAECGVLPGSVGRPRAAQDPRPVFKKVTCSLTGRRTMEVTKRHVRCDRQLPAGGRRPGAPRSKEAAPPRHPPRCTQSRRGSAGVSTGSRVSQPTSRGPSTPRAPRQPGAVTWQGAPHMGQPGSPGGTEARKAYGMTGSQRRKSKEAHVQPRPCPSLSARLDSSTAVPLPSRAKGLQGPPRVSRKLNRVLSFVSQIPNNCRARSRKN